LHSVPGDGAPLSQQFPNLRHTQLSVFPKKIHELQLGGREFSLRRFPHFAILDRSY
jgi:hypothetical protein